MQLVLASTSPRRRELLALLGVPFDVVPPAFEEHPLVGLSPREQVEYLALEKARSIANRRPGDLVLGSDTVIELDGRLLGKPRDLDEARDMLIALAGRSHEVHTAVALCRRIPAVESVEVATALVYMHADAKGAIERYLASGESLDKAGAYSIQGAGGDLVERIEGDFTAVVGLPLAAVVRLLVSVGYHISRNVAEVYRQKPYPNWSRFAD
jgi:septum formation protein